MRTPVSHATGSTYEGVEYNGVHTSEYHHLDDMELDNSPSEWELDRQAVFAWAKKCLSWGMTRKIPLDLVTSNLRCGICKSPTQQAVYVSYFRDLYCERHYQKWLRQLRKKPKSQKKLRQEELEEWVSREHYCSWHDVKNGMFSGGVNASEASCGASSEML
jgi:hypothetical protein